jgi:hypothetical protein
MELIYFLIFIFVLYVIYRNVETLQNTKMLTTDSPCKNCNIWNHLDAKTKCNNICKQINQDNSYNFSGKWINDSNNLKNSVCQCNKLAHYNKKYVGCALGKDCFLWNNSDAKSICPKMCNQYLLNKNAEWTGNWKSTSIDSSACECQYYD